LDVRDKCDAKGSSEADGLQALVVVNPNFLPSLRIFAPNGFQKADYRHNGDPQAEIRKIAETTPTSRKRRFEEGIANGVLSRSFCPLNSGNFSRGR